MQNKPRIIFYLLWLVLLIMQAFSLDLFADEAYYVEYSKALDFGYFDHPPMIALFIKMGYSLLHNELGVRLFSIITSTLVIYLLEKAIAPQSKILFYKTIASIAILHILNMLATPDLPLLFFVTIYFIVLKKHVQSPNIKTTISIAMILAAALYSKYHAVLLVIGTLVGMPSLLKQKWTYIILVFTSLCMLPHLWWQYQNGFPSIMYHFKSRNNIPYSITFLLEYLITLPFILGPLVGLLLLLKTTNPTTNNYENILQKSIYFIYAFFLLICLRGRAEAHWTLIALVPLLLLNFARIEQDKKYSKLIEKFFIPSVALLVLARLALLADFVPASVRHFIEPLSNKQMVRQVQSQIKASHPNVLFMNSYQSASLYNFYTGKNTTSLNNYYGRNNQFHFWDYESEFIGKPVTICCNYEVPNSTKINLRGFDYWLTAVDSFMGYNNVAIKILSSEALVKKSEHQYMACVLECKAINGNIRPAINAPIYLKYIVSKNKKYYTEGTAMEFANRIPYAPINIKLPVGFDPGKYTIQFGIATGILPATFTDAICELEIR